MGLDLIKTVLPLLVFVIGALVVAVRLQAQVKELQKDLDLLLSRDTYVSVVRLQAQQEQTDKNISALWHFCNTLRNKFNGHK